MVADPDKPESDPPLFPGGGKLEMAGGLALGLLLTYFLGIAWRKWPDPMVDVGAQLYGLWRVSSGATLYHEIHWYYGPLSVLFDAGLFRFFGPDLMVLVTVNLVVYGLILALAYVAFRRAWGRLAAFCASAVFVSVFSFSQLTDIANYNYATPYAFESTHGLLLTLVILFLMARWQSDPSRRTAFLLGFCGGLTAVLKPEFMLAGGLLGLTGLALRIAQQKRILPSEIGCIVAGLVLPTLGFTAWFLRHESWSTAFIDASQAWWLVFFNQVNAGLLRQGFFSGFDQPWANAGRELEAALYAIVVLGTIVAGGWFVNRPWKKSMRVLTVLAAAILACSVRLERGWIEVGRCFPGMMAAIFVVMIWRVNREIRDLKKVRPDTVMALGLVVLAGAMLARMILYSRVYHFGFYQGAFAGMVLAAVLVAEVPQWVGAGLAGQRLAAGGAILVVALGCYSIAQVSRYFHSQQSARIGAGPERFYAFNDELDVTRSAATLNWALDCLRPVPADATLVTMPDPGMINYLTRHIDPLPPMMGLDEAEYVKQWKQTPPDYVIILARDLSEFGVTNFGAPGNPGYLTMTYIRGNYALVASHQRDVFLRRKP